MKDKLFDDFIKDKLSNRVATVPVDMWERVIAEKELRKNGFWTWKSFTGIILLGCFTLFFAWYSLNDSTQKSDKTAVPLSSAEVQKAEAHLNQNITDAVLQHSSNITVPSNSFSDKKVVDINNKKVTTTDNTNQNTVIEKNILSDYLPEKQNRGSFITSQNRNVLGNKVLLRDNFTESNNTIVYKKAAVVDGQQTELNRPEYDKYDLIHVDEKQLVNSAFHSGKLSKIVPPVFSVDCPTDRLRGNHGLYFEMFASPDIAIKKMEYKSLPGGITPKDSNTSRQLSYTFGFRFAKEIGQNLLIKTGLQYAQINERFDYRNENERTTSMVITIRTITNSNGTTTTVRDTSIVEQVGYRVKTSYNYYRTLDIPLLLGYEIAGEGWRANFNGGAVFNISSSQSGDFLDTSYRPASFSKKGPAIFKSKLGISLYGSVSLIKEVSNVTSLFAEPYIRYSLADRTTNTSPFVQRFHTMGLLLGVRFKLK